MRGRITIITVSALLLGLMIWLVLAGSGNFWPVTFKVTDTRPYGTYLLYNLLMEQSDTLFHEIEGPIDRDLTLKYYVDDPAYKDDNYLFIGRTLYLTHLEIGHLVEFASAGNNVFIFAESFPTELLDALQGEYDEVTQEYHSSSIPWREGGRMEDSSTLTLLHPTISASASCVFNQPTGPQAYYWRYLLPDTHAFAPAMRTLTLGELQGYGPDLLAIQCGRGWFYIHLNPIAHTNHFLRTGNGLKYTMGVLGHLGEGNIYWDLISHAPKPSYFSPDGAGGTNQDGPLYFLLQDKSLRWSVYVLLTFVLLFLVFRGKRQQRIIPVIHTRSNTSMEFVRTIANLYYLQNDPRKLAVLKHRHFIFYVRTRYHLRLHPDEEVLAKDIAKRSGIEISKVTRILELGRITNAISEISEELLSEYYQLLDDFYQNSK